MKTLREAILKEALFNKKNLENKNPYNISKEDMIKGLKGFPVGVVVRMMEEAELQGNTPDVRIFQIKPYFGYRSGGFDWKKTEAEFEFWEYVIKRKGFEEFFEKYPQYEKYN